MAFLWGGVYREGGNTTDPKSKQFFDLNPPIHKPIHLSPPFIFQTLADYCLVHVTENIEIYVKFAYLRENQAGIALSVQVFPKASYYTRPVWFKLLTRF